MAEQVRKGIPAFKIDWAITMSVYTRTRRKWKAKSQQHEEKRKKNENQAKKLQDLGVGGSFNNSRLYRGRKEYSKPKKKRKGGLRQQIVERKRSIGVEEEHKEKKTNRGRKQIKR